MKNYFLASLSVFAILVSALSGFANTGITVDEIVSKHLESIGTKEKRSAVKNQIILGTIKFGYLGTATTVNGKSLFVSGGNKNLFGVLLNSNDYPQEKFGFDGSKVQVAFTKPGVYSVLGDWINSYKGAVKESIFGGTLFSTWILNNNDLKFANLKFVGTKKVGAIDTYVLAFAPKMGLDLEVKLFFEKNSFRHIRTEYLKVIAARQAPSIDASAGQSSDRIQVIEDFSGFQNMGGLTLPSRYSLGYTYYNNSPIQASKQKNKELNWVVDVNNFSFNQDIDEKTFEIGNN